ncbi:MAG: carbohydrate kinase [Paracoccaceae bacterium]|nr:carbohydrate kinase [Paracoccaceae bacterium]
MARIWFLGEALIDFVPATSDLGPAYAPRCGGSPYNAAKAAALAGADVGFLGALSSDLFGDMLAADLDAHGIDTAHAPRLDHATTLAFVDVALGDPRYAFFNAETATREMVPDPAGFPGRPGDILGVGSISLIDPPGAGNIAACAEALADRVTLAVDPNARPAMTGDPEAWRARIRRLADRAGIVKLSVEDLAFLAPGIAPGDFAAAQLARGTDLVVVTDGAAGAEGYTRSGRRSCPGRRVEVADTVGAGDTVTGYLLEGLAVRGLTSRAALSGLTPETLGPLLERAVAAAALTCTASGCMPPSRAAVEGFLSGAAV